MQDARAAPVRKGAALWIATASAVLLAAGLVSVAFGPDNNWDLRYYHLYAPWAYLHGRYLVDVGPAQYQGFFNPTADFLFYALVTSPLNETPRLVAFVMGAVHGINAVLLLAIAKRVLRPARGWERSAATAAAFVIGASGAGFLSLLGTTTNDLIVSIFVLAALNALLHCAEPSPGKPKGFALAGLLAGLGIGLKYTAAVFAPGLALVALAAAWARRSVPACIVFAGAALAGFAAAAGHHMHALWRDFGNPFFPLFNQIFQSPFYEPGAIRDPQFLPASVWRLLAYPFEWSVMNERIVAELPFRDPRIAIMMVAVLAGGAAALVRVLRKTRRPDEAGSEGQSLHLLVVFGLVSFFVWGETFAIYRYAVPIEMLSAVVAIGMLVRLVRNSAAQVASAVLLAGFALAWTVPMDWGRGAHPSAGMRPAPFGPRYVDVQAPPLPQDSIVLLATTQPAAYFIPYAEPGARYLGIENNYLRLSQTNRLASEVKTLMRAPDRPKFILRVGGDTEAEMNGVLGRLGLRLSGEPCRPIVSNLEEHPLALCRVDD